MAKVHKATELGAGLNFKIVGGTTQPASPKENTIWISTDTAIGEYQFSATEPTTRADGTALQTGDVWISVDTGSNVAFSAVKKYNIQVYPIRCKQFIAAKWEDKTAKSFIDNQWKPWLGSSGYLYKKGDEFIGITGGWKIEGYGIKEETSITIGSASGQLKNIAIGKPERRINLTQFTKLVINFTKIYSSTSAGYIRVIMYNTAGEEILNYTVKQGEMNLSNVSCEVDISAIKGDCDIHIIADQNSSAGETRVLYATFDEVKYQ